MALFHFRLRNTILPYLVDDLIYYLSAFLVCAVYDGGIGNQVKSKVTVKVYVLWKQSCPFSRHFGVRLLGGLIIICRMQQ
jgi:hypothetical protein